MERFMYRDESFEGKLKEKADEYRMYPSEQSWNAIQKQLKRRNRTFNFKSFGLSTLLLLGFSISVSDDELNISAIIPTTFLQQPQSNIDDDGVAIVTQAPVVSINRAYQNKSSAVTNIEKAEMDIYDADLTLPDEITNSASNNAIPEVLITKEDETLTTPLEKVSAEKIFTPSKAELHSTAFTTTTVSPVVVPLSTTNEEQTAIIDSIETPTASQTDAELNYEVNVPVVIKQPLKKQVQFYLSSGASYRVLYNDKQLTFGNLLNQDPENVARHKPSIGLEAGTAILFPISNAVKFRTGLQLNYTHYNVEVFRSAPQVATISFATSGVVQRMSALRTDSGRLSVVKNETLQLSIPLGFEFRLVGKRKVQWNVATNIQPTYLITASGYFLTNDMKKYVKAPDLLSNLNLNTALETFIRWDLKDFQLQAGPQLRYQLFSNTRGDYPIKEHLVDYGFRIGLVKTLK